MATGKDGIDTQSNEGPAHPPPKGLGLKNRCRKIVTQHTHNEK